MKLLVGTDNGTVEVDTADWKEPCPACGQEHELLSKFHPCFDPIVQALAAKAAEKK